MDNDFDPDDDTFSIVEVANPANGTAVIIGTRVYYTPANGFSGVETITYTLRDSHGLTATGTLTVWVDSSNSSTGRPNAQTDYFYVYQGSSIGFTAAQLLDNDSDPENQTITVAVVSEPSNNGILVGNPTDGYTYTPSTDARSPVSTATCCTSSPTPTTTSNKAPSPSASSPPATPTNHPSLFPTRRQPMARRLGCW